jgi:hypothetical protein
MTMPGFTARCAVSPTGGGWRGRPGPARGARAGQIVPQQDGDWSRHCEQFGTDIMCCDCWDGQCFCRRPGPIYEF